VKGAVRARGARVAPGEVVEGQVVIPRGRLSGRPAGGRLRGGQYLVELS
jgi:hypothetical protein